MIKQHPTYGNLTIDDHLLTYIREHIDDSLSPVEFSWGCEYTLFNTIIVPKAEFFKYEDVGIIPPGRFLFVLVNFRAAWHFNVDDPPHPNYVDEKLGLGQYDSRSVSLFLEMLRDIKQ